MATIPRVNGELQAADGVTLKYSVFGDRGPWVVMVHAHMSSAYLNWIRPGIPQKLAGRYRVVVFDCRNHGISGHPEPGGRGIARDVVEVMDHLGIERAHLHGYCMGGLIVITLIGAIPHRILTASFGGAGVTELPQGAAPPACSWSEALVRPSGCVRAVELPAIRSPVLGIVGEADEPEEKVGRMRREVAGFRSVVLPGCDHLDTYRHPLYAPTLADFIDAHGAPAPGEAAPRAPGGAARHHDGPGIMALAATNRDEGR